MNVFAPSIAFCLAAVVFDVGARTLHIVGVSAGVGKTLISVGTLSLVQVGPASYLRVLFLSAVGA